MKSLYFLIPMLLLPFLLVGSSIELSIFPSPDYVLLKDGTILKGRVEKIKSNSYKFDTGNEILRIKNKKVMAIAFGKDLSNTDKFKLGVLDGKKYAVNKGANFAVGFFFGYVGTAIVYASSSQEVSNKAKVAELGQGVHNKILDDYYYAQGFAKGAKSNAGGNALIGSLTLTTALLFGLVF